MRYNILLSHLLKGQWLDDEIIGLFSTVLQFTQPEHTNTLRLVADSNIFQAYAKNTFRQMLVARVSMIKRVNPNLNLVLMFPCCRNNHWILYVYEEQSNQLWIADSLNLNSTFPAELRDLI